MTNKTEEENKPFYEIVFTPSDKKHEKEGFFIYEGNTWDDNIQMNSRGMMSVKGKMQELTLGVEYKAKVKLDKVDPTYGASYWVDWVYQDIPNNMENQRYYLQSMMTENQVKALYVRHGNEDILELFKQDKIDYRNIYGWAEKSYKKIRKKILDSMDLRDMFVYLGKYGIKHDTVKKLIKEFGSAQHAISEINKDVYALTRVPGIGFKTADAIAMGMGMKVDNPGRIKAAIRHVLKENEISGDTYATIEDLVQKTRELLNIHFKHISEQVSMVEKTVMFDGNIALKQTYYAEHNISVKLKDMAERSKVLDFPMAEFLFRMEKKYETEIPYGLTDEQKQFFYNVRDHSVCILAGYGGTGKSFLQKLIKELIAELKASAIYLCPTGKSSKVLSSYIGEEAHTMHRAIGFGMDSEVKAEHELWQDFLIVEEWSMGDVFLTSAFLDQIKNPHSRIIFIGDPAQAAAVSAGNVLNDMISSGIIKYVELTKVWRQKEGGILDIATRTRQGIRFLDNNDTGKKKFGENLVIHCISSDHMESGYKYYYNYFLQKYQPEEIMVLSSTNKNNLGTVRINRELQKINNPLSGQKQISIGEDAFLRVGDYVINKKNNYSAISVSGEVFTVVNGDTGKIIDIVQDWKPDPNSIIDEDEQVDLNGIHVDFSFAVIVIPFEQKHQLVHSWALSIHASQGSSAKAVIVVADKAHKFQLTRNLLYVAGSRATDREVILTQAETFNFAMKKVDTLTRKTLLDKFLRDEIQGENVIYSAEDDFKEELEVEF